ncbi:MAG: hypothetical protein ACK46X_07650, partial [Candidatus Sericytochromatia bacterium]
MINSAWFAPALFMNASAILALFLLSWAVARRHRTPYFAWWTASAGFNAVGALLQAVDVLWFNHPVTKSAFIGMAFITAIAMIASARRFR